MGRSYLRPGFLLCAVMLVACGGLVLRNVSSAYEGYKSRTAYGYVRRQPSIDTVRHGHQVFLLVETRFTGHCLDADPSATVAVGLSSCRNNSLQWHADKGVVQDSQSRRCLVRRPHGLATLQLLHECDHPRAVWYWRPTPWDANLGQLHNKNHTFCLDNSAYSPTPSDLRAAPQVHTATCASSGSLVYPQLWRLHPLGEAAGVTGRLVPDQIRTSSLESGLSSSTQKWQTLKDAAQGVCLGQSVLQACQILFQKANVQWELTSQHQMTIAQHSLCMSAASSVVAGSPVAFRPCNIFDSAQQWSFIPAPAPLDAFAQLRNEHTGLCLDSRPVQSAPLLPSLTMCAQPAFTSPSKRTNLCHQSWRFVVAQNEFLLAHRNHQATVYSNSPSQARPVNIVCWVLTMPRSHQTRARSVNETWGRSCDHLLFISTAPFATLNVVILHLDGPEGREQIWEKTKMAWLHVHDTYIDKADYFLKADDDTFVHMGNLRAMLAGHDPERPEYFGRRLWYQGTQSGPANPDGLSYNSGGAGYLLSREALRRFAAQRDAMVKSIKSEDALVARVLRRADVQFADTRDEHGLERFLPSTIPLLRFGHSFAADPKYWLWSFAYYPPRDGMQCCSPRWIATHYVHPRAMYEMQWTIDNGCSGV